MAVTFKGCSVLPRSTEILSRRGGAGGGGDVALEAAPFAPTPALRTFGCSLRRRRRWTDTLAAAAAAATAAAGRQGDGTEVPKSLGSRFPRPGTSSSSSRASTAPPHAWCRLPAVKQSSSSSRVYVVHAVRRIDRAPSGRRPGAAAHVFWGRRRRRRPSVSFVAVHRRRRGRHRAVVLPAQSRRQERRRLDRQPVEAQGQGRRGRRRLRLRRLPAVAAASPRHRRHRRRRPRDRAVRLGPERGHAGAQDEFRRARLPARHTRRHARHQQGVQKKSHNEL